MAGITIITGASAGIGADLAREAAKRGWDVLLTARREDRLRQLSEELSRAHRVKAHVVSVDLSTPDGAAALLDAVSNRGYFVEGLINNAGFGQRGDVAVAGTARQLSMIDLNVRALTELTARVLPGMIERRHGRILNVASIAAFQPGPHMAVYYATKAYVLSFTEALHEEVRDMGIKVSALCPGPTTSEFFEAAGMTDMRVLKSGVVASSRKVAADGIRGLEAGRAVNVSGAINSLTAAAVRFLPRFAARRIAGALQK